jgi:hypothetical protein
LDFRGVRQAVCQSYGSGKRGKVDAVGEIATGGVIRDVEPTTDKRRVVVDRICGEFYGQAADDSAEPDLCSIRANCCRSVRAGLNDEREAIADSS